MTEFAALSQRDRATVTAMQDAMRAVPEPYRSNHAASNIWIEGYMAGALAEPVTAPAPAGVLMCTVDESGGMPELAAAEALLTAAHGPGSWVVSSDQPTEAPTSERIIQWGVRRPGEWPPVLAVAGAGSLDEKGARSIAQAHDTVAVSREVTYGEWTEA